MGIVFVYFVDESSVSDSKGGNLLKKADIWLVDRLSDQPAVFNDTLFRRHVFFDDGFVFV